MSPEFSRPLRLARLAPDGQTVTVRAEPAELAALARRFAVPAVLELACEFHLRPQGRGVVAAEGSLAARLERVCVATLEPFVETVAERFALRFVPEGASSEEEDFEAPDEIPYAGAAIDLGEAAAEQLALAFDPWPRKAGPRMPGPGDPDAPAGRG